MHFSILFEFFWIHMNTLVLQNILAAKAPSKWFIHSWQHNSHFNRWGTYLHSSQWCGTLQLLGQSCIRAPGSKPRTPWSWLWETVWGRPRRQEEFRPRKGWVMTWYTSSFSLTSFLGPQPPHWETYVRPNRTWFLTHLTFTDVSTSWYKPGQTPGSVLGEVSSSMEECRAETVALFCKVTVDCIIFDFHGAFSGRQPWYSENLQRQYPRSCIMISKW